MTCIVQDPVVASQATRLHMSGAPNHRTGASVHSRDPKGNLLHAETGCELHLVKIYMPFGWDTVPN
jgi:hypothetical protein